MAGKKIRVAIVGAGRWGSHRDCAGRRALELAVASIRSYESGQRVTVEGNDGR